MVRFIHAADVHLDSPLRGLERYPGAPVDRIRGATRQALENLVSLSIDARVDLVLFAGDLYDGEWRDYNTGLYFSTQMSRLRAAGIRVVLLNGNHDAASEITRLLRPLENMHILSVRAPETLRFEDIGVAIHGQGFSERAITRNLVTSYPEALDGLFNIGMLHTSLSGRDGHEPYAPCTVDDLLARGYDYWALGHVHQYEEVRRDPWIVFPGNSQGRHIRETGPKGCTLVEIEDGRVASLEFRSLDVLRWSRCRIDAAGARDGEAVLDRAIPALQQRLTDDPDRIQAVRLEIVGACQAHADFSRRAEHWLQELRAQVHDATSGQVWLEKVTLQTRSDLALDQLAARDDLYGALVRALQGLEAGDPIFEQLERDQELLRARLPPEALRDGELLERSTPEAFDQLREDLLQRLIPSLVHPMEVA